MAYHYECIWEPLPPEEPRYDDYKWTFKDGSRLRTRLHHFEWKASVYLNGKLIAVKYDSPQPSIAIC